MKRILKHVLLVSLALVVSVSNFAQDTSLADLKTVAESSAFTSTSTYKDVMAFVEAAAAKAPALVRLTSMGKTVEGKDMPLVVIGTELPDSTPTAVRASGKLRVYVQAGLHGGEADGKEAALLLVRDLASGRHLEWWGSIVLLVNPVFNADGNDRIAIENRPGQNGPVNGSGQRTNAQNLDLNRDHVKLETPEASAFAKLMQDYDPQVTIDLHTTNGVCAGYVLTYALPLHPSTSPKIVSALRTDWFPFITKNMKTKNAMDTFYTGTVENGDSGCGDTPGDGRTAAPPATPRRGGPATTPPASARGRSAAPAPAPAAGRASTPPPPPTAVPTPSASPAPPANPPAWRASDYEARVQRNYAGLRNRFALEGNSYAYATFEDRIKASRFFLEEAIGFAFGASARLKTTAADADAELVVGRTLALAAEPANGPRVEILMGGVDVEPNPVNGVLMRRRNDLTTPVQMIDRTSFDSSASEITAAEYYIPASFTLAIDLLRKHGITLRQLTQPTGGLEEFVISSNTTGPSFEGHTPRTLKGTWQRAAATATVPAGTWVVRMNQPLAKLAFTLLEPASADGLAFWNVLDDGLKDAKTYPISRKR